MAKHTELTVTPLDSMQLENLNIVLYILGDNSTQGWGLIPGGILESLFTLAPRFVLNMRELYAHDVQSSGATGIDTAFGLSSLSDRDAVKTEIVFADVGQEQDEMTEHVDDILEGNRRDTSVV